MPVAPDVAKDLSEKSNQELQVILEKPDDWTPEIVEFARSELVRRSIADEQISQQIAINAKKKAEEPLTGLEAFFAGLYGVIGLIGLIILYSDASGFKKNGFLLKSKKSWKIFWIVFSIKVSLVILILGIIDLRSPR